MTHFPREAIHLTGGLRAVKLPIYSLVSCCGG